LSGDPAQLNKAITGQDFNSARYSQNRELLDVLKNQISATDADKRQEYLDQVQELYAEEMPTLPLY